MLYNNIESVNSISDFEERGVIAIKIKRLISIFFVAVMLIGCTAGCSGDKTGSDASANETRTHEDYMNSKVGVVTGSYSATIIRDIFPDAEVSEFNSHADLSLALSQGKIDITPTDISAYTCMLWDNLPVTRLEEVYECSDYGIVFKKGENTDLRKQVNDFIAKTKTNGVYDELQQKWFGAKEPTEYLSAKTLNGTNGTLKIITCPTNKPFGYIKNGEIVGYDIDFLILFAQEYGYKLDITSVDFSAVLTGIASGNYDIAVAGFTITEERAQSVDFSDVYHVEDLIFVIPASESESLKRFENANLGVVTGSLYGGYSREQFPHAEISEFNNFSDTLMALKQGKIDGTMLDRPNFNSVKRTDAELVCTNVPAYSVDIGFGFQKNEDGDKLQQQMNGFLDKLRKDGTLDELISKWYGETEPNETVPLEELSSNAEKLKVSVDTTRKPFVYMYNNKPVGFEIEVLYLFCREYGYDVEISDVSFASGLAGLSGGKYDMVCGGLYMTPERKESVNFSEPYMTADVVMASYEKTALGNMLQSLGNSFEKTFIRESRWKLVVDGVITTLIISFFSVVFGSVLGFLLYLAARSEQKILSTVVKVFAKIYSKIIAGTPTLVILMILFYIVFGSSDLNGTVVAIIGFTLTFASFVYGQLDLTVNSIDKGQTEAAFALGYSKNRTFMRIVLPQAMRLFIPVYSAEIVSLIKATSVVGYIAVNDLTKVGDIIRSNTYEAFFPLIAVAVIYFIITWAAASILNIFRRKTEPKRRKNIKVLKGVVR